jgi:hypothetical protein
MWHPAVEQVQRFQDQSRDHCLPQLASSAELNNLLAARGTRERIRFAWGNAFHGIDDGSGGSQRLSHQPVVGRP